MSKLRKINAAPTGVSIHFVITIEPTRTATEGIEPPNDDTFEEARVFWSKYLQEVSDFFSNISELTRDDMKE